MELLLFLQEHRTPGWDALFLTATRLGEETVVLAVLLLLYWCLDKRAGLRVGLCYFAGGWMGQLLKLVFLVPRPFLLNEALTPTRRPSVRPRAIPFPPAIPPEPSPWPWALGFPTRRPSCGS